MNADDILARIGYRKIRDDLAFTIYVSSSTKLIFSTKTLTYLKAGLNGDLAVITREEHVAISRLYEERSAKN